VPSELRGRIGPIKAIKNPRKVFRCNPATGIPHHDFRLVPIGREGNGDSAAVRCEMHGIVHQVTDGPAEQDWIGIHFTLANTGDGETAFFRDRFVVSRDPFDRRAPVEMRVVDFALGRFGASEKEQIIDDVGEPLALRHA
jgi:hypothetical protein